ncbi:MAG TPA: hypothetical protein VF701_10460 [Thermoanaerobaculia bacterium]
MALTAIQRDICRLLAAERIASGESYVAGGAALITMLEASRRSQDLDLFHDTEEALQSTWSADRNALNRASFALEVVRERPAFIEAVIRRGDESVILQWTHDSAFRFFPLVEHPLLGLTLHPFDLATNKILALVGRVEARDWIDIIACDRSVQPLGYLVWAASGKDPGLTPDLVLEQAGRSARYSASEIEALDFDGEPPDPAVLSRQWKAMLATSATLVDLLPPDRLGTCVLCDGDLFLGDADSLRDALAAGSLTFHAGSIRGALPRIVR